MKLVLTSCAAALLVGAMAAPAFAGQPITVTKAIAQVQVDDLDLTSSDGQADLDKRMNRATRSVCAVDNNGQVRARSDELKCRTKTLAALKAHFAAGG